MGRDVAKYQVDGVRVPSVTEVIELAGLSDFSRIAPDVLAAAALRGQEVHEWCDLMDEGIDPPWSQLAPNICGRVKAYAQFLLDTKVEVLASEEVVVNPRYRYAGTLDMRALLNGDPWIIDRKTPQSPEPWWGLQLAGYSACHDEKYKRGSLSLLADGTYRLSEHRDRDDYFDFYAAVRVAHFRIRTGGIEL